MPFKFVSPQDITIKLPKYDESSFQKKQTKVNFLINNNSGIYINHILLYFPVFLQFPVGSICHFLFE